MSDETPEGFAQMPRWLQRAESVSPWAKLAYLALSSRVDKYGQAHPSHALLAKECSCSVKTIKRALEDLRDLGVVTWEERYLSNGSRSSNVYTLRLGVAAPAPAPQVTQTQGGVTQTGPLGPTDLPPRSQGPTNESQVNESQVNEPALDAVERVDERSAAEETADLIDELEAPPVSLDASFEAWYVGYPRKVARADARKAWPAALLAVGGRREHAAAVLADHLALHAAHWRDVGTAADKVPYPATWLRGRRWEDHLEQPVPPSVAQLHGRPLLPAAPVVRNRHCDHGYLPGVRAPDGGIETCPYGCLPARSDRGASHG